MRHSKRVQGWPIVAAALILCCLLALLASDRIMRTSAITQAEGDARADVQILAAGLQSELEKFLLVPPVLSEDPDVIALLRGDQNRAAVLDRRLATLAAQTGAAAIYLMDASGLTLSSSNHAEPDSFVGSNYGFRPYFDDAIAQGRSTEFALGTVSRRPGLYITRRIGPVAAPLGVVAVKVEFDALEASWQSSGRDVFVSEGDGIVLITSDPQWRFRAIVPVAPEERDRDLDRRRFGVSEFAPLLPSSQSRRTVSIPLGEGRFDGEPAGWTMHLRIDPASQIASAMSRGRLAVALAAALLAMLGTLALFVQRRRAEARERDVAQRTALLRDQLSQANRLATLGQIGAGISHEIRQPVAAMRVLAESGAKLVESGNLDRASTNFGQISQLADRIGTITGELLRFVRRGTHDRRAMPIGEVIDGALLLLGDRITGLDIAFTLPGPRQRTIAVLGEHVRLEQVLVNLLQNALDAAGRHGRIAIEISKQAHTCLLCVTDDGPGLSDDAMDRLFQPFATTKEHGLGLGLVISKDIMRVLDGDLRAERPPNGGARFVMEIPLA